jgi:signal transduction histidine kinase/ActR/RegA family two-component response regulator
MKVDPASISAIALDALVDPVLFVDAEGCVGLANGAAVRAFGPAAELGCSLGRLLGATAECEAIARALQQRQALIGLEVTLSLPGGPTTYVVNTIPARDGASGSVVVFHDVTVARTLEREAAEHAARLQALVDVVDQAIYIIGADGRTLFANALGREQLGDAAIQLLSPFDRARALAISEPDGRPVAADDLPFSRAMRGETVVGTMLLIRHATRGVRRMRVSAHPLRRPEGGIHAVVVAWKDVTDEHRALDEVETARQAAEEASRLKDEFIAALSHELRTPLQPILGWTEVLRRHTGIDDVTARALEAIRRNVRHQVRLVDDLLDLSRIVHGKLALRFEAFDLREQVRLATEAFEEAGSLKRVKVAAELPPAAVVMWGDGERVHQVVTNLVSNALKFTPSGGRIDVRLSVAGAVATIEVADNGEGIALADLSIIWEPFRQGRHSPRRGGLGIGLDLVRRLTELHGGHVAVRSEGPGRGACFRIDLPLATPAAPITDPAVGAPGRLAGRTVLLIEDNADTREVLKLMLEVEGAAVETAEAGEAGVRAAAQRPPDAVLCDIGLPDIDGMEVVRRLRRTHPGALRCIALTGYGQAEDVRQAIDAGFDAHLTKPINLDQLMTLLASEGSVDTARGARVE